jgi:hypothetical protein
MKILGRLIRNQLEFKGMEEQCGFTSGILAHRRFNLLGLVNPGEKIPRRNLVKTLLDLIKGTNLFTQE